MAVRQDIRAVHFSRKTRVRQLRVAGEHERAAADRIQTGVIIEDGHLGPNATEHYLPTRSFSSIQLLYGYFLSVYGVEQIQFQRSERSTGTIIHWYNCIQE